MGGPGSGPQKGQRRGEKHKPRYRLRDVGDDEPEPLPEFPREIIDAVGVFGDEHGNSDYTKTRITAILDLLCRGIPVGMAAELLHVGERTIFRWLEQREDFATMARHAKAMAGQEYLAVVRRAALDGNPVAAFFWLNANYPEVFVPKNRSSLDVNFHLEGAVDVNHILKDPTLIAMENALEARRQQLEDGVIIEGDFKELPEHEKDQGGLLP